MAKNKLVIQGLLGSLAILTLTSKPASAELLKPPTCTTNMYPVAANATLPYQFKSTLNTGGLKAYLDQYYIYTLNTKSGTYSAYNQTWTKINKVSIKHLYGTKEPITILDYRALPKNSNCTMNNSTNEIECTLDHTFQDVTQNFIQMLVKINSNKVPNTSTMFTVETDTGNASCATMLYIDPSKVANQPTPINWQTKHSAISAKNFQITIGDEKFFGVEPITLHTDSYADGSDNTYTTLEATWIESPQTSTGTLPPVEMRLNMYFNRSGNQWKLSELRTYNGNAQGDWIYYKDSLNNEVSSIIGQHNYVDSRVFTEVNGQHRAQITCDQCDINAFMDLANTTNSDTYAIQTPISSPIIVTTEPDTSYYVALQLLKNNLFVTEPHFYTWNTNSSLITIEPDGNQGVRIIGNKPGTTSVLLEAKLASATMSGALASKSFTVTVNQYNPDDQQSGSTKKCVPENQPVITSEKTGCCIGLRLIPSADSRTDVAGYCVDKNSNDTHFTQLEKEITTLKQQVADSNSAQSRLEAIIKKIQTQINKLLKLFNHKS